MIFLRLHYHMTSIGFISTYFSVLPWMLIGIGVVAFLVSAFGLIVSATEVKELLYVYAATMAIICIGLFGNSKPHSGTVQSSGGHWAVICGSLEGHQGVIGQSLHGDHLAVICGSLEGHQAVIGTVIGLSLGSHRTVIRLSSGGHWMGRHWVVIGGGQQAVTGQSS